MPNADRTNGGRGEFLMVVDDPKALPTDTLKRLEGVCSTLDGYAIAEQDLLLRGFGELDGAAQTGASETLFKLVNLTARDFLGAQIESRQKAPPAQAKPSSSTSASGSWKLPSFVRRSASGGGPQPAEATQPMNAGSANSGEQSKLF